MVMFLQNADCRHRFQHITAATSCTEDTFYSNYHSFSYYCHHEVIKNYHHMIHVFTSVQCYSAMLNMNLVRGKNTVTSSEVLLSSCSILMDLYFHIECKNNFKFTAFLTVEISAAFQ
jgi:hypothetical protein